MLGVYALIVFAYFMVWYIITLIFENAGLIDIGWGFGFVVLAAYGLLTNPGVVSVALTAMVAVWGFRLSVHVFQRNVGKPEDYRYAAFRVDWGKWFNLRAFFQLFMFQALMMLVIALAFIYGNQQNTIHNIPLFMAGILVWLVGFFFETVGDAQLKRFIANPENKGKVIDAGLWRYSRHPNYFGEAVLWWGVFMSALACGAPWWTAVSPITITLLVRFVSGVPMLEKRNQGKPGYESYCKRVNVFIPWFRKEEKSE